MKSNASDLCLELLHYVYTDACSKISADVYSLRDLETIRSRVEKEGLSFLTITLPRFANDLEKGIANGRVDPACFTGFHRVRHVAIPELFQGMLGLVFDRKTGELLYHEPPSNPNRFADGAASDIPTIIESLRQICCMFKKVELECTPKRVHSALRSFTEIEQDFKSFSLPDEQLSKFLEVCSLLWGNMFRDFSPDRITPKHGPGATADKISGNQKYLWRRWHDRLEPFFPLIGSGYSLGVINPDGDPDNPDPLGIPGPTEEIEIVTIVPEEEEQPVRVVTVPKTLKSPRVIAIEPCCMQFAQQGIRDYLYDKLESHWLTAGHINFTDQSINQRKALTASRTGQLATIDLSEASDRVSLDLAMKMFDANPDLRDSILACRSTRAQLPDGSIIGPLLKFASMGSALCFPVEAMYFYTICIVALLDSQKLSYTQRNIRKVSRRVYVYGDDIIVPSTNADTVLDYLQKYNCKVNVNKTFVSGSFRESCGVDAFAGYVVTPTYLRHLHPENRQQGDRCISWVATANLFYKKGYWRTTTYMRNHVESILGELPYVRETSPLLGHHSFLGYESIGRWNRDLQRNERFGWIPRPVYRPDALEGWAALAKCFISMESRMSSIVSEGSSLERSALHGAVNLKRRWAPTH